MPAKRAPAADPARERKSLLARLHCLKRDLGFDDDTYRSILEARTGKRSGSELSAAELRRVVAQLGEQSPRRRPRAHPGAPSTLDREPMLQKIEALLADMRLPWSYADAIGANITGGKAGGIQRLGWIKKTEHLRAIIAALTVEQQKRELLADVDLMLRMAGKTREDVTARLVDARKGDWQRNRAALKQLLVLIPEWWPAATTG